MNLKRYPYRVKWLSVEFEFDSIGPRGVIKKVVGYRTKIDDEGRINLSLGDWNEQLQLPDHIAESKNRDTDMVLATVAATCIALMNLHPGIEVVAKGATDARNRLYRMGIVKNWDEIQTQLEIEGLKLGAWEPFNPNTNYEAFRARRRQQ